MQPEDEAAVAALPRKSPPLAALTSNRVCPEPSSATPPSGSTRRRKGGEALAGHQDEEKEEVVCTMIGDDSEVEGESQATLGDQATYDLNGKLDDSGDKTQLIHSTKKKSVPEAK